ncbi:MAG: MazG nucleotide pyrophosphohydrolase domain-containing protein [bacterium]
MKKKSSPYRQAIRVQKKASKFGFDWNNPQDALAKIFEEARELSEALNASKIEHRGIVAEEDLATAGAARKSKRYIREEVGDILFAALNVARLAAVSPDSALKGTIRKFEHRFAKVLKEMKRRGAYTGGRMDLATMDALWEKAKKR